MDLPIPVSTDFERPYWDALKQGRLLIQRCKTTGRHQWYPRERSLFSPGGDVEWVEARGHGKIETFTVVHRSFYTELPAPYVIAMVRLDEDVVLTTHIVDTDLATLRVGLRAEVVFVSRGDHVFPAFRTAVPGGGVK